MLDAHAREALADAVRRFDAHPSATDALGVVLELLRDDPASLTSIREPSAAVDAHVADSLAALVLPEVRTAAAIADLGAGGGFPGLALAAARPEATVALVESVGRKCDFLRRAVADAGLDNVTVVHARAEEWREGLGTHDLVTARALAPLSVIAEYAAPLLSPGGALVAWKGRRDAGEERDGAAAARQLGLDPARVERVEPFASAGHRHLHVYLKVKETPQRFPRRAGMARKRPLRGSTTG